MTRQESDKLTGIVGIVHALSFLRFSAIAAGVVRVVVL